MDRLTLLGTFVRVAELSSFTQAAKSLNISRAVATRQLLELESLLGVRLFNRTTRSVALTADGERVLLEAEHLLAGADAIFSPKTGDRISGTLRVASSVAFAEFFLAREIERLLAAHPLLRVELIASHDVVPLVAGGIDVGFEAAVEPQHGVSSREIGRCSSYLCAAPELLAGRPPVQRPEDLADLRQIAPLGQKEWVLARGSETRRVRIDAALRHTSATLLLSSALRGAGVACLPDLAAAEHLRSGRLVRLLPEWSLPTVGIHALLSSERLVLPAAQVLVSAVEAAVRRQEENEAAAG